MAVRAPLSANVVIGTEKPDFGLKTGKKIPWILSRGCRLCAECLGKGFWFLGFAKRAVLLGFFEVLDFAPPHLFGVKWIE